MARAVWSSCCAPSLDGALARPRRELGPCCGAAGAAPAAAAAAALMLPPAGATAAAAALWAYRSPGSYEPFGGPVPASSRVGRDRQRYSEGRARLVAG